MPVSAAHLRRLAALNLPAEAMGEVLSILAEIEEGTGANTPGAIRTRRWREKRASRGDITGDVTVTSPSVTESVTGNVTHAGARAEPKITNSSSTHSENNNKEKQESTASASPRLVACLMPDDFEPDPELVEKAVREWGYTRAQVFEKRDALHDWSHGKNQKRTKWNSVLSGALRSDRDKLSTGPPGRPTNGHGKPTFADILRAARDVISEEEHPPDAPDLELKALTH